MTLNLTVPDSRSHGPLHGCPIACQVVERFTRFDLNVEVDDRECDALTDWCEDNGVTWEIV